MVPCREWPLSRTQNGYGQRSIPGTGKSGLAHRLEWEIHFGPIPEAMQVCHKCDNRGCYEIEHLFLGTPLDNMRDKVQKDRQLYGSKVSTARLDEDDVKAIKEILRNEPFITQLMISELYGVAHSTIKSIAQGRSWRRVTI